MVARGRGGGGGYTKEEVFPEIIRENNNLLGYTKSKLALSTQTTRVKFIVFPVFRSLYFL